MSESVVLYCLLYAWLTRCCAGLVRISARQVRDRGQILMVMRVFCFFVIFVFFLLFCFLMRRRPPRSTLDRSSAASDVYKRQVPCSTIGPGGLNYRVRDGIGCGPSGKATRKRKKQLAVVPVKRLVDAANLGLQRVKKKDGQAARPISTGQLHALLRFHTQPIASWSTSGL